MAGPETIPPWDRLAQGPSRPPLSAIPQTKYMCREREAWPQHRWPALGPSHLGTGLLKARPPPRGTVTSSLARPETLPPGDRLAQGPSPPHTCIRPARPKCWSTHVITETKFAPPLSRSSAALCVHSRRPRPHCPPLRGSGAKRLPLARPHKTRANGIWDSQAVTDLGTNQTRLRFTAGS